MSSRRPRVLQVGKYYPPHMGGIETHLQTLCAGLAPAVDLRVVVSNDGPRTVRERVDGFDLVRLGTTLHVSTAPVSLGLRREIDDFRPDIVHVHLPGPAALAQFMLGRGEGALVLSHHSDIVRQRLLGAAFSPLLHAALRRAAAVLVATPQHIATSRELPPYRAKCRVVPYGIDVEHYAECLPEAAAEVRKRFGGPLVLGVGRLVYYKGFNHLIRALARTDAKLLLIGRGPLRAELEQDSQRAGVADRVFFLDGIGDLRPYYQAADLFVLPSTAPSEAFGIVQLEAMASGIPVINTSLDSGVPFVSLHGVTGLTVPPGDEETLASAISELLRAPELRRVLGAAGKDRVEREFTSSGMIARTLAVYSEVHVPPRPAGRI